MIGLALVTLVATLGREPQEHRPATRSKDQVRGGLRRDVQERLRHVHLERRQRAVATRPASLPPRRCATTRRAASARTSTSRASTRRRSATSTTSAGRRARTTSLLVARLRRGDREEPVRERPQPRSSGASSRIQTPQGKKRPLVVRGIYNPPAEQLDALFGAVDARAARLRHALPAPEEPVRLRRHRRRHHLAGDRGARQDARPVSRRDAAHQQRLGHASGRAAST